MSRGSGSRIVAAACIVLLAAPPLPGAEGVYESVALKERERPLFDTCEGYEQRFLERGLRYTEDGLETMLAEIGEVVSPESADSYVSYRFHVLRDPFPNAFALPDGQVYVQTGMLAMLENVDQLAALVAHEVTHVAGHHGILTFRSARKKIITGIALGPFTLGLSDIFIILAILGYSRDLEEEADRRGLEAIVAAGWDGTQMARLFEVMDVDPEGVQLPVRTSWSDHPQLRDRAAYLGEQLESMPPPTEQRERMSPEQFRARVRNVALLTVDDYLREDFPRTAVWLARRLVDEMPEDPRGWLALGDALYGLGPRGEFADEEADLTKKEKKRNIRQRRRYTREELEAMKRSTEEGRHNVSVNTEAALEAYERALELDPGLAEAHRGIGLASIELGREEDAARALMVYARERPDALDRKIIMDKLRDLAKSLREKEKGAGDEDDAQD